MRLTRISTLAAAVALTAGSAIFLLNAPTEARQDKSAQRDGVVFNVDSVHSSVIFRIKHMGVAYNYGRFNNPKGTYNIDPENPDACFIDIQVAATDVDTANEKRDNHLRSPDFFNVKQYPTISVTADDFKSAGDNMLIATGTLTMHGESKPIEISIDFTGEAESPRGHKSGFEAEFEIKRTDFGMDTYVEQGALGDEVNLYVAIEGAKS